MLVRHTKRLFIGVVVTALTFFGVPPMPVAAVSNETIIESGIGVNDDMAISGDGGTIAFMTTSSHDADDTNGKSDVYVYDIASDTYELVSLSSSEVVSTDGNSSYNGLSLSYDGRYVLFASTVTDLVAGDTNGFSDVFVRDRTAGTTERISVDSSEGELNNNSFDPSITNDGELVVFWTAATDVIGGSDTNGSIDVFMRNRTAGTTERVSLNSAEAELTGGSSWVESNSISGDGRYVAFMSYATNAVASDTNGDGDVFLRDIVAGTTVRVSVDEDGNEVAQFSEGSVISNEGTYVVFRSAGQLVLADDQALNDVYVYNTDTAEIRLASSSVDGEVGDDHSDGGLSNEMFVSSDGRFVLFDSEATNFIAGYTPPAITTLYVKDMVSGEVEMVNDDFAHSRYGFSDNGSKIIFRNGDSRLILGYTANADPDEDGIPNSGEYAAPNEGDANNDSIADAEQANVASYVNPITGEYAALAVDDDCAIQDVNSTAESGNTAQDATFDYPSGLMTFTLACSAPGLTVEVTQYYHDIEFEPFDLRKYNSTTDTYQAISDAALQGTSIDDGAVNWVQARYQITDGGELDEDGVADSTIVDPSGLALSTVGVPNTGLGGQHKVRELEYNFFKK
jgi:hypothetical protein